MAALIALVSIVLLAAFSNGIYVAVTWWYICAGGLFIYVSPALVRADFAKAFEWELALLLNVPLLLLFSNVIYPAIKPGFGGGAPIAASLHLRDRTPHLEFPEANIFIIEENQDGYYVLKAQADSSAYFVPRNEVVLVDYGQPQGQRSASPKP